MQFTMTTVLILVAFGASISLLVNQSDRTFPTVAVIASGIELLVAMGLMSLTLAKFRVDVILPSILVVAGIVCWTKVATKGTITAATAVTLIGAIQLVGALRILG